MVSVNSATAIQSTSGTATPQKKSTVDYDSFLKLLVTQMKNQDPTKPMDSTEYVAQLASFSNVEQTTNANRKLDDLIQQTRIAQGIDLIGKQVTSLDGLGTGTVESVKFDTGTIMATLSDGHTVAINNRVTIGR